MTETLQQAQVGRVGLAATFRKRWLAVADTVRTIVFAAESSRPVARGELHRNSGAHTAVISVMP